MNPLASPNNSFLSGAWNFGKQLICSAATQAYGVIPAVATHLLGIPKAPVDIGLAGLSIGLNAVALRNGWKARKLEQIASGAFSLGAGALLVARHVIDDRTKIDLALGVLALGIGTVKVFKSLKFFHARASGTVQHDLPIIAEALVELGIGSYSVYAGLRNFTREPVSRLSPPQPISRPLDSALCNPEETSDTCLTDPTEDFFHTHGNDWIAHAVSHPESVRKIVETGYLKSAEDILRSQGSVEFESGIGEGQRAEHYLFKLSQPLKESLFNSLYGNQTMAEENVVDLPVERIMAIAEIFDRFATANGVSRTALMVAYDESLEPEHRVDSRLAAIWNGIKDRAARRNLQGEFVWARRNFITESKLFTNIRWELPGKVRWSYGHNVFIKANWKHLNAHHGFQREIVTLDPFQNGGKFLRISLQDPNLLLLGPQSVLEPLQEKLNRDGVRFQTLESLPKDIVCNLQIPEIASAVCQ